MKPTNGTREELALAVIEWVNDNWLREVGDPARQELRPVDELLAIARGHAVFCRRAADAKLRRTAAIACLAVAAIALVWGNALPFIVRAAVGWPLAFRVALAAGLMVPAGMVMGVPLPSGVRLLAARQPQLVPWAWGINGALSVLGATLAVFVAMNWGFSVTLICGAAVYACAALLIK